MGHLWFPCPLHMWPGVQQNLFRLGLCRVNMEALSREHLCLWAPLFSLPTLASLMGRSISFLASCFSFPELCPSVMVERAALTHVRVP